MKEGWWEVEPDHLAAAVVAAAREADEETVDRQQRIIDAIALYSGTTSTNLQLDQRISHNVISNATDALVSEVSQAPPRPMAISIGGTYGDQIRCKKLTAHWDAKVRANDIHSTGLQCLRDGIVCGAGSARVYDNEGSVSVERLHPLSVIVDDKHCVDVLPRSLYLRRAMDRHYTGKLYPEHEEEITRAPSPQFSYWIQDGGSSPRTMDLVEVWEAWHLPSGKDSDDGRHVLVVGEAVLVDEKWERSEFPIVFIRPILPLRGFWGEILVERAKGAQSELNKLLRRIQDAMHLHAAPRVFVPRQSGVVKSHITNNVGAIIEYDGAQPPVFMTPPSMSSEVYNHIDRLTQWIYDEMGVSRMTAESMKPAGLNSGRAIRLFREITSRRHINTSRAYEQFYVDMAREMARLEKKLAEEDPKREVVYERNGIIEKIPWRDIDLDEEAFRIGVFPASALPTTPGAKLEALQEMVQEGILDPKTMLRLADVPDMEYARDLVVSPSELVEQILDRMMDTGTYDPPDTYMDLLEAKRICALKLMRARIQGAPEDRLDLLRDFWVDADDMLTRSQVATMGAPPGMPPEAGGPIEMPMPPTTGQAPDATLMPPPPGPGMLPELPTV